MAGEPCNPRDGDPNLIFRLLNLEPGFLPRFFLFSITMVVAILFFTLPGFSQESPEKPSSDPVARPTQAKPADQPAAQNDSQDQNSGVANATEKSKNDRMFYVMPNYLTVDNQAQVEPISWKEKFAITAKGSFDPYILFAASACAFGQDAASNSVALALSESTEPASLDTQAQENVPQPDQAGTSGNATDPKQAPTEKKNQNAAPAAGQQPQRILGVMPNFRAVSAGTIPPPPTAKQAFVIATKNSFDYSSFIFVGITSALAEWTDAHPQLGEGMAGYGQYYWRGFVDKTDGNYLVIFALPTLLHQDERYYAMGKGSFVKRAFYAASRVFITPNYEGHNTFNASEVVGRGMAQGISLAYYPSQTQTASGFASKYAYAIGRDALANVFREFWPDIALHVLHRHP